MGLSVLQVGSNLFVWFWILYDYFEKEKEMD